MKRENNGFLPDNYVEELIDRAQKNPINNGVLPFENMDYETNLYIKECIENSYNKANDFKLPVLRIVKEENEDKENKVEDNENYNKKNNSREIKEKINKWLISNGLKLPDLRILGEDGEPKKNSSNMQELIQKIKECIENRKQGESGKQGKNDEDGNER